MRPVTKLQPELYTVEEYLAFERAAEERHEYIDGEIRAMAGESPQHGDINVNLLGELRARLKGKPCRVISSNTKIRSGHPIVQVRQPKGVFSYADVSIVCAECKYLDKHQDVLLNPAVIFEILSPSTESFDRGEKFWRYRAHLESLTDYVLISQTEPLVEHYRRQPDDQWLLTTVSGLKGVLKLASIGCELALAELYYGVAFPRAQKSGTKTKPRKTRPKKAKSQKDKQKL